MKRLACPRSSAHLPRPLIAPGAGRLALCAALVVALLGGSVCAQGPQILGVEGAEDPWSRRLLSGLESGGGVSILREAAARGPLDPRTPPIVLDLAGPIGGGPRGWRGANRLALRSRPAGSEDSERGFRVRIAPAEIQAFASDLGLDPRGALIGWTAEEALPSRAKTAPLVLQDRGEPAGLWIARLKAQAHWIGLGPDLEPARALDLLRAAETERLLVLAASPWIARRGAPFAIEPDLDWTLRILRAEIAGKGPSERRLRPLPRRRLIDAAAAARIAGDLAAAWLLTCDEVVGAPRAERGR